MPLRTETMHKIGRRLISIELAMASAWLASQVWTAVMLKIVRDAPLAIFAWSMIPAVKFVTGFVIWGIIFLPAWKFCGRVWPALRANDFSRPIENLPTHPRKRP